jgi:hypothetical protein
MASAAALGPLILIILAGFLVFPVLWILLARRQRRRGFARLARASYLLAASPLFIPFLFLFDFVVAGMVATVYFVPVNIVLIAIALSLSLGQRGGMVSSTTPCLMNVSEQSPWTTDNDELVEAIKKSNTHPQAGVDKIKEILTRGVNINAKNESGRTVLAIAIYYESPSVVRAILLDAGGKESA